MKTIIMLFIAAFTTFSNFALKSKANLPASKTATASLTNYSCPMHPAVVSPKQGKCTKCNMALTLSKKEQMKEVMKLYTCPMHSEMVSRSSGTCVKCSSKLVVDRRDSKQASPVYNCSMHADDVSTKPGKRSACGMDMEAKNKKQ